MTKNNSNVNGGTILLVAELVSLLVTTTISAIQAVKGIKLTEEDKIDIANQVANQIPGKTSTKETNVVEIETK